MASRRASGFTLIEVMVAMVVLVVGALGLLAMQNYGIQTNADARVLTRATALAQDLASQMQMWDYANDPRLANGNKTNDADPFDHAGAFQQDVVDTTAFDHQESELETSGAAYPWFGTPTATAQGLGFTRYWNIAEDPADANGAKRVAVIVRWANHGAARRIVLVTVLRNPQSNN